ncbi:hypothetical protein SNE40_008554 [Patella caerulea]
MGKPKQSESMICESCRNNLDTASVPCTCIKSPGELEHSTPIRENKENQKKEQCPDKMVECAKATELLQKAESNLKVELQRSDAQELQQSGYNKLADENRQLKEKLERLEKEMRRSKDDMLTVAEYEGGLFNHLP